MSRLNWQQRHGPDEFDDTAPHKPSLEFDLRHAGGAAPWPAQVAGVKFGPALIERAWQAGLFVYAEIEGWPHPVTIKKARWFASVFEVLTLEGWLIPRRIFTRPDARGVTVGGVLIE